MSTAETQTSLWALPDAVQAAFPGAELIELAQRLAPLSPALRLGTSSWSFPGWRGLVWKGEHREAELAREGLRAYARHPLLRTVSLDRSFYRPMRAEEYAVLAAQVPADFRFMVKAPAQVTDAVLRGPGGSASEANPHFLDAQLTRQLCIEPALAGLGPTLGTIVFEISPLPQHWKRQPETLLARLSDWLDQLPTLAELRARAPEAVLSLELRDPELLTPDWRQPLAELLRQHGMRYCLGLHPRLPPIEQQLPLLRALWPGPFVGRWSLNRRHGASGYETAKDLYAPFDRLVDPDPTTRAELARVMRATAAAGQPVLLSINNKAEGSAPLSVIELAREIAGLG